MRQPQAMQSKQTYLFSEALHERLVAQFIVTRKTNGCFGKFVSYFIFIISNHLVTAFRCHETLRARIQQNNHTLRLMQQTDQQIQQLLKTSQGKNNLPAESLLGTLQTEINNSIFASSVTDLRQGENDSTQFKVHNADFDQLIVFLTSLWKNHHFIVADIAITPTAAPGEVNAAVVIQSANAKN